MRSQRCVLALGVLAVLACARSSESTDDPATSVSATTSLVGPRWRLVELEGQPSLGGGGAREAHLIFSRRDTAAQVQGATGCNTMGGTYEADGSRLRFSQLFSTKMACVEEDRMSQETRFLRALESVDRYEIRGDSLTLSVGERVLARFVK